MFPSPFFILKGGMVGMWVKIKGVLVNLAVARKIWKAKSAVVVAFVGQKESYEFSRFEFDSQDEADKEFVRLEKLLLEGK